MGAVGTWPDDGLARGDPEDADIRKTAQNRPYETGYDIEDPAGYLTQEFHREYIVLREKLDKDDLTSPSTGFNCHASNPMLDAHEQAQGENDVPKPPSPEKKYFEKIDVHKRRRIAEDKRKKMAAEERARLKELHWRKCGNCGMDLEEISFKRQNIHKCFNCGAVLMLSGTLESLCGEERRVVESLLDLFKF